ncbi:CYP4BF1 protein [Aphelenchoides avenae]|nr:CYP4BF1 protein [Aphelenchus avenae]
MGVQLNALDDPNQPYVRAVEEFNVLAQYIAKNPFYRLLPPLWYAMGYGFRTRRALKVLKDTSMKIIRQRAEIFEDERRNGLADTKKHKTFLDLLLSMREESKYSFDELREEVDTFMFAGHDTTSHAIAWSTWCLATNPAVQEKLYEELNAHFGDSDRDITVQDLKELRYLNNCINESMRVFSPVPLIQRELRKEMEIGGKLVPEGATIGILPLVIHHNHKVYPNHDEFDPDNFLPERVAKRHTYDFIPFSAGPRNCIGQKFAQMEIKTTLAHIFRRYKLTTDAKMHDNGRGVETVLRPVLGIPVRVSRR